MSRVLCVNASGHFAGAEAMLVDLASRLNRERWRPLVLLPFHGELGEALAAAGVEARVWPLAAFGNRLELRSPLALARIAGRLPASVLAMASLIRSEGVGLVHTNSSVVLDGALAARLAGVPHLWHVREVLTRPRGAWAVLRWAIATLSARVLCVSPTVAAHFGRLPRRLRRRLRVVPDGVAVGNGAASPHPWPWPAGAPVVGTTGRINGHKGQEDFVRAAAQVAAAHPAARFVVMGGALPAYSPLERSLHELARELGVAGRVLFLGQLPRREVRHALAGLSVFVMPSRITEGFGLAALEAMAAGVPVVGTTVGARELVRDGVDGLLVPHGRPDALAERIDRLLSDPALARRLGASAQRRAGAELTIERHVATVEALYDEASRQSRRGVAAPSPERLAVPSGP